MKGSRKIRKKITQNLRMPIYRVSINSFPDYKHLVQENYVEYKNFFLPLLKVSF